MNEPFGRTLAGRETAARWTALARRAPVLAWRRAAYRGLLTALTLPGAFWLGNLALWSVRTGAVWALRPLVLHGLVVLVALGLPARRAVPGEHPRGFLGHLLATYGARADRLRALRRAVLVETGLLVAWPPLLMLLTGASPRWGVTSVIALCTLTVLWPLERIAAAQHRESRRLATLGD